MKEKKKKKTKLKIVYYLVLYRKGLLTFEIKVSIHAMFSSFCCKVQLVFKKDVRYQMGFCNTLFRCFFFFN